MTLFMPKSITKLLIFAKTCRIMFSCFFFVCSFFLLFFFVHNSSLAFSSGKECLNFPLFCDKPRENKGTERNTASPGFGICQVR